MNAPHWKHEQPRCDVPREIVEAADLRDMSWHNDVSASFAEHRAMAAAEAADAYDTLPRLWVDEARPERRENFNGRRFVVCTGSGEREWYTGDNAHDALRALRAASHEFRAQVTL